jgi:hypothetical protein
MKVRRNLTRFKRPMEYVLAKHVFQYWKNRLRKQTINNEND